MEYTVNQLAKLSGISTRTLRYYDQIGLLKPAKVRSNGYRIYEEVQIDKLQQILFYKELGVSLDQIDKILSSVDYDRKTALKSHMHSLLERKTRLDLLIRNVSKTIASIEGEITMTEQEKFEGFKREVITKNEKEYGMEIREKYGEEAVNVFNQKLAGATKQQWDEMKVLEETYKRELKTAIEEADPAGEAARSAYRVGGYVRL